ncbi:unnamed protein product [Toxocara canis]|uniref:PfkB domain-containing protein n=1 Tax=Toxocara canis TaxID=6265 RepID=A0A183V8T6_TOXCA|nr:unnamed protein product [Toxocara canis]
MRAAYRSNNQQQLNQVKDLLDGLVDSRLQRICLYGCVMLAEERPLQFAEHLHNEEYTFGGAEVNFLCDFALHNKEPKILESLVGIPELFKLDEKARNAVYGSLAVCYGGTIFESSCFLISFFIRSL